MLGSNIHEFSDLECLKSSIRLDLEEYNISAIRYPIRFIFLNSHDEVKEIVALLKNERGVDIVPLEKFLCTDDGWLTPNQIIDESEELNKDSVIVPLSEFIRFLEPSDFYEVLHGLAGIEKRNIRLYVPLVGLWERFEENFWKDFNRKNDWAPIWKLNSNNCQIKVYQLNFDFDNRITINDFKLVKNSREWFSLWKKDDIDNIISFSRPLCRYFENTIPDKTFDREIINTPKEYLQKILESDINIPFISDEMKFWIELIVDISKKNQKNISLKSLFMEKFNINNIEELQQKNFFDIFISHNFNDYQKWIAKNVFLYYTNFKNSYLAICLKSLKRIGRSTVARKIMLEIFNLEYTKTYLDERRNLLKNFNYLDFSSSEKELERRLINIQYNIAIEKQLNYFTDTTPLEKQQIFNLIHKNGLNLILPLLKNIFPDLYYYLDWNITLNNKEVPAWVINYFKEYNKSKVLNSKSEMLVEMLSNTNKPDTITSWHYDLLYNYDINIGKNSFVIWIDALGAEWLSFFVYYLNRIGEKFGKKVIYKTIMSVNLPTATKFNKPQYDLKIGKLDKFIHDSAAYYFPDSLLEEIKIIRGIAQEIVSMDYPKISIISDHGFSFLCTKNFGEKNNYSFENSAGEGRYFLVENGEYFDNEDYFVYETESVDFNKEKYVVSLNHVSLNNFPAREVHGGATPEEVLVPYIVFGHNDENIEYKISTDCTEINISKENDIIFSINPTPTSLPIAFCNDTKLFVKEDDDNYILMLDDELNKGEQKIIIKINDEIIGELNITIKKGGMEETKYDFG